MFATLILDPTATALTCVCEDIPAGAKLTYRLMRHSTLVDQPASTSATTYGWDLSKLQQNNGDMHAEVTVSINGADHVLVSEWQYAPSAATRAAYKEWLGEQGAAVGINLPETQRANRPFETLAFIRLTSKRAFAADLTSVAASTDSVLYSLPTDGGGSVETVTEQAVVEGGTYLLSSTRPIELPGTQHWAVGSGVAFHGNVLRRSSQVALALSPRRDSADDDLRASYTSQNCGDFLAAAWGSGGAIEFHTDYVGASAWFEYHGEGLHIVASTYLLATAIARAFGEPLFLNLETIDADFTSLTQSFQQPLLDDLELSGFSTLRPDTVLIMTQGEEDVREASQLGRDIACPDRFTVARYNELLDLATSELLGHCAAIGNDDEVGSIRCDISGGLDSRMVLAGFLAGTPDAVAKLSLYTDAPENAPSSGDEEIASMVAQATGLTFSDQSERMVGPCSIRGRAAHQIAASFGTYWHRGHAHLTEWDPTRVYAGGAGLDNFARDYTTGSWQLVTQAASAPREVAIALARQMFKWRGRASLKAAPHAGITPIAAQWDNIPGDEIEKGAQLFNFYRARFHGGGSVPAALGALRLSPGPTRSLYRLRLMAGRVISGPRAQLEILHRLNPELAAVPFVSSKYNETFSVLYGSARTDLVSNVALPREAASQRRAGQQWTACPACSSASAAEPEESSIIEITQQALRELANDPELNELMLPAYRFATELLGGTYTMRDSYGKTFVNKVLHLHAAWQMSRESRGALEAR